MKTYENESILPKPYRNKFAQFLWIAVSIQWIPKNTYYDFHSHTHSSFMEPFPELCPIVIPTTHRRHIEAHNVFCLFSLRHVVWLLGLAQSPMYVCEHVFCWTYLFIGSFTYICAYLQYALIDRCGIPAIFICLALACDGLPPDRRTHTTNIDQWFAVCRGCVVHIHTHTHTIEWFDDPKNRRQKRQIRNSFIQTWLRCGCCCCCCWQGAFGNVLKLLLCWSKRPPTLTQYVRA